MKSSEYFIFLKIKISPFFFINIYTFHQSQSIFERNRKLFHYYNLYRYLNIHEEHHFIHKSNIIRTFPCELIFLIIIFQKFVKHIIHICVKSIIWDMNNNFSDE